MSSPPDEYPSDQRKYPNPELEEPEALRLERLRARALADLSSGRWAAAEQGFTGLLTRGGGEAARDALAIIGVAQARLFGRLDSRGAFAMLQALLHAGAPLEATVAIRLDIVAAFLFATVDGGLCDPARARAHAAAAVAALESSPENELRAMAASAELLAISLNGDRAAFLTALSSRRPLLDAAREPVARCLRLEILALAALAALDPREPVYSREALDAASTLGFAACEARLQACAALRALDAGRGSVATRPLRSLSPPSLIAVSTLVFPEALLAELRRLAPSRVTVLLVGGSTRLKADAARALHELSPRVGAPFVTFDCTAQGSDAVELLLFGGPAHERPRGGSIHAAETGTLYVSAIDELPLLMQPRFLRFLDQEKRVRVVASAGADLAERVRQGQLRPDLGERLTLVQLLLPDFEKSM